MQRMTGYDLYVSRQVLFECCKLRRLAGSLTTDNGARFGSFLIETDVSEYMFLSFLGDSGRVWVWHA
jgi:hypothetical protein